MIAIKGIELPESCYSCRFAKAPYDSDKKQPYCTIVFKKIPLFRSNRPGWCPLVDVDMKEESNDDARCPYYASRMETRYLSDAAMCELYRLTGQIKRSAELEIGHCMETKNAIECHCDGLKERCDHK